MFERFTVDDAFTDDNSIINLSPAKMEELGVNKGEVVLLKGKMRNETVGVVLPDKTIETSYIKLSQSALNNLEVNPKEQIRVSKINNVEYGFKIHVLPFENDQPTRTIGFLFSQYIKPYFELAFRPVMVNNVFEIKGPEGTMEFKVMSTTPKPICIVSPDTIIFCNGDPIKKELEAKTSQVSFEDVGGLGKSLELIRDIIETPLLYPQIYNSVGINAPRGILMYGPPGTGKTLIARAIACETSAHFLLINGPELMSKFVGESENNLRKIFNEAARKAPSIVFIDEIDSIAPKRSKVFGEMEKRMVAQLLTLMDGINKCENIVVIAATNQPGAIDSALRRYGRFDKEIEIGLPDEKGRLEILSIHTKKLKLSSDVNLHKLASETYGFTGADLKGLCVEAASLEIKETLKNVYMKNKSIDLKAFENLKITNDKFEKAQKNISPSGLRDISIEIPKVGWNEVAGLDDAKEELMEIIQYPLNYPNEFRHFDLVSSKGILLFGPPGCGKTLTAKAFASECGINFISIKGSDIMSMWFGESENNIKEIFSKARNCQPCIIFFDEMDSLGKIRDSLPKSGGAEDRVVNQLLMEMDGMQQNNKVFVIGATNRIDNIDSALLRPGRIDKILYIPLPNFKDRFLLFRTFLSKTPVDESVNMESLAHKCEGFSGADICELIRRSKHLAMKDAIINKDYKSKKLKMEHIEKALEDSCRTVSQQEASLYDALYESFRQGKGLKKTHDGESNSIKENFGYYS